MLNGHMVLAPFFYPRKKWDSPHAYFVRLGLSLFFLIALAMVFGSTLNILPILLNDIPKRCNSVAFWESFWYK